MVAGREFKTGRTPESSYFTSAPDMEGRCRLGQSITFFPAGTVTIILKFFLGRYSSLTCCFLINRVVKIYALEG